MAERIVNVSTIPDVVPILSIKGLITKPSVGIHPAINDTNSAVDLHDFIRVYATIDIKTLMTTSVTRSNVAGAIALSRMMA